MFKLIAVGITVFVMAFEFPNAHSSELISKSDLSEGFQLSNSEKKDIETFLVSP